MYLNEHKPNAKLYLVGTESLKHELLEEGFEVVPVNYRESDIDYVLLGFDTELNYEKVHLIRPFLAFLRINPYF